MKKVLLLSVLSLFYFSCEIEEDAAVIDDSVPEESVPEESVPEESTPEPSTLIDGALLHYPFDGNFEDVTVNEYHGTNSGTVFTTDRLGNENSAVLFDGIDDYIDFPNLLELKPELPLSFSFWIRYDSEDTSNRSVFNTSFEAGTNSGVYFNSQSSTGYYAVNFGEGSYVDKIKTEGTYSGSGGDLQYSDTSGSLGRHYRSPVDFVNYFKGALDDFRYWNRTLTEDEIEELYAVE